MPILDEATADRVKGHLAYLRRPVELIATLDERIRSEQLRCLVEEIALLSDRVTARFDGGEARRPSLAIRADEGRPRVIFAGLPVSHEFSSLMLALLHLGGHPPREEEKLLEAVRNLDREYRFETYFQLSCQICPDVVQALNIMASLNPKVSHVAIDGVLFKPEAEARNVSAVPIIFLNGEPFGQGPMNLARIMAMLAEA